MVIHWCGKPMAIHEERKIGNIVQHGLKTTNRNSRRRQPAV
jgi:hypothetical protein